MIFNNTGKIDDNLYMLGHPAFPVYLFNGPRPAIFDSGLSLMGNRYVSEIQKILVDRDPAFLFLTHSHYDHCGSAATLKKAFPAMQIAASPNAKKVLERPNALRLIHDLNQKAHTLAGILGITGPTLNEFESFSVDRTVREGDILNLSETASIRTIETPGHTRDSLAFFIQERGILISAEALGIPDTSGYIISDFLSSYEEYVSSMIKLQKLNPRILCIGHYKAFTGEDTTHYIDDSMNQCNDFKNLLMVCLTEEKGDLERVMKRIKKIEYDGKREDIQPEAAYYLNLEARIKAVLAGMGDQG